MGTASNINLNQCKTPDVAHDLTNPPPPPPPPPPSPAPLPHVDSLPATSLPVGMVAVRLGPTPFPDGISVDDVRQGRIGDCTLQAALAALAASAQGRAFIRNMIHPMEAAPGSETWRVDLYVKGANGSYTWTHVVVARKELQGGAIMSDTANGRQVGWPRIIEAAVLRAHGNVAIANMPESYAMLTGTPATDTRTSDRGFEAKLRADFAHHRVQCLSTTGAFPCNLEVPFKLKADHCYTITGVRTLDGKTVVTLRNPWGWDDPPPLTLDQVKVLCPTYSSGALP